MASHAADALAPVFLSSCVTGEGLDLLRLFVDLLPIRRDWAAEALKPAVLVVDEAFAVSPWFASRSRKHSGNRPTNQPTL
jgi:GTPase